MNKSTKNSDAEVDASSIFNHTPRPASPFLAVSPLLQNQYNFARNRTSTVDASRLYGKLFTAPDFGALFDTRRTNELKETRVNMPSIHDWLAPLGDNSKAEGAIAPKQKGTGLPSKNISTASMVMVNPKAKEENGNFAVKENIVESDEQRFNLTTIYLKRFNMFSNSCNSLPTVDEIPDEPLRAAAPHKRIKKLFSHQSLPKTKSKGGERKVKRKITCNCKNSRCVKMYCECFRENGFCGNGCKCKDCKNFVNSEERALSMSLAGRKQAEEFAFKISKEELVSKVGGEGKGCKCKKSQCNKKYRECYNEGALCGTDCACVDCLNAVRR